MKYKLFVSDLDGTLTEEDSAWWTLHKHFGTMHHSDAHYKAFREGKIDYLEWMRKDLSVWENPTYDEVKEVVLNYHLRENAELLFGYLKNVGMKTAIVTAGLDFHAEDIAMRLGADYWFGNGVEVGPDGRITGKPICVVPLEGKAKIVKNIASVLTTPLEECVALSDSIHDLDMLEIAGLSIGFRNPKLEGKVDYVAKDLGEVVDILQKETATA